jgi:hypothetical protein
MLRRANAPAGRTRAAARARRQARRLQATELFAQGVHPAQVARTLGASRQSASPSSTIGWISTVVASSQSDGSGLRVTHGQARGDPLGQPVLQTSGGEALGSQQADRLVRERAIRPTAVGDDLLALGQLGQAAA